MEHSYLDKNIAQVREDIASACRQVGRGNDVLMLAAVKSADVEEINYIHNSLGVNDIGENRVQQLIERYEALDKQGLNIHFIGHLQTNKVKYIIDKVCMIHSVDSVKLANEISTRAKKLGKVMKVLVEINIGEEENKDGAMPKDVPELCRQMEKLDGIELCGFMTMAPRCEKEEDYVEYFSKARDIAYEAWRNVLGRDGQPMLSMGMSESYRPAIACGSSLVRVGRRLFIRP